MISHWSTRPLGMDVLSLPRQDSDIRGLGTMGFLIPPDLRSYIAMKRSDFIAFPQIL